MGIAVEFNPDLALRDISEFKAGRRKMEECIPEVLEVGKIYDFFKKEQRIYYLLGEVSLIETTTAGGSFSKDRASVNILEVTHFLENGQVCTRGKYEVVELCEIDKDSSFEKCSMIK
jgi:hypothetical protein